MMPVSVRSGQGFEVTCVMRSEPEAVATSSPSLASPLVCGPTARRQPLAHALLPARLRALGFVEIP